MLANEHSCKGGTKVLSKFLQKNSFVRFFDCNSMHGVNFQFFVHLQIDQRSVRKK